MKKTFLPPVIDVSQFESLALKPGDLLVCKDRDTFHELVKQAQAGRFVLPVDNVFLICVPGGVTKLDYKRLQELYDAEIPGPNAMGRALLELGREMSA